MLESLFNKVDSKDIKEAPTEVFSCEYCEIFKKTFLRNSSGGCFCCFKLFVYSQENIVGGGSTFIFLINTTTEYNKMLMCY